MEVLSASPEATRVVKIPPGGDSYILFTSAFRAAGAGGAFLFSSQHLYMSPCGNAGPGILLQDTETPLHLWPCRQPWEPFAHLCKGSSTPQSTLTPACDESGARAGPPDLGEVPWGAHTAAHQLLPPSLTSPGDPSARRALQLLTLYRQQH